MPIFRYTKNLLAIICLLLFEALFPTSGLIAKEVYALFNETHGRYLCADLVDGNHYLSAETGPGPGRYFELIPGEGDWYFLKSEHGRYLSARAKDDPTDFAVWSELGQDWEKFWLERTEDGRYFYLRNYHNKYLSVDAFGGIYAKDERGENERFSILGKDAPLDDLSSGTLELNELPHRRGPRLLLEGALTQVLRPGQYMAEFEADLLESPPAVRLVFEVVDTKRNLVLGRTEPHIFKKVLSESSHLKVTHELQFQLGEASDALEFRVWWNGQGRLHGRSVKWRMIGAPVEATRERTGIDLFIQNNPKYEPVKPMPIGEGYFGIVHLVRDKETQRLYALKLPNLRNLPTREQQLAPFHDDIEKEGEINRLAAAKHWEPFFPKSTLFDNGGDQLAILKEFVKGPSLRRLLLKPMASVTADEKQALDDVIQVFQRLIGARYFVADLHADNLMYDEEKKRWYIIDCNEIVRKATPKETAFAFFKERSKDWERFRDPQDILVQFLYRARILNPLAEYLRDYQPFLRAQRGDPNVLQAAKGFDPNGIDPRTGNPFFFSVSSESQMRFLRQGANPFVKDRDGEAFFKRAAPLVRVLIARLRHQYDQLLGTSNGQVLFSEDIIRNGYTEIDGRHHFFGLTKDGRILSRSTDRSFGTYSEEFVFGQGIKTLATQWFNGRFFLLGIGFDHHLYLATKFGREEGERRRDFAENGRDKGSEWFDLGPMPDTVAGEPMLVRSNANHALLWVSASGKLMAQKLLPSRKTVYCFDSKPNTLRESVASLNPFALSDPETENTTFLLETQDYKRVVFSLPFDHGKIRYDEKSEATSQQHIDGFTYLSHAEGKDGWTEFLSMDAQGQIHQRIVNTREPSQSFEWQKLGSHVFDNDWVIGISAPGQAKQIYMDVFGRFRIEPKQHAPAYVPYRHLAAPGQRLYESDDDETSRPYVSMAAISSLADHIFTKGRDSAQKIWSASGLDGIDRRIRDYLEHTPYLRLLQNRLEKTLHAHDPEMDSAFSDSLGLSDVLPTLTINSNLEKSDFIESPDILIPSGVVITAPNLTIKCNTLRVERGAKIKVDGTFHLEGEHIRFGGDIDAEKISINSSEELVLKGKHDFKEAVVNAKRVYVAWSALFSGPDLRVDASEKIVNEGTLQGSSVEVRLPDLHTDFGKTKSNILKIVAPFDAQSLASFFDVFWSYRSHQHPQDHLHLVSISENTALNIQTLPATNPFGLTVEATDGDINVTAEHYISSDTLGFVAGKSLTVKHSLESWQDLTLIAHGGPLDLQGQIYRAKQKIVIATTASENADIKLRQNLKLKCDLPREDLKPDSPDHKYLSDCGQQLIEAQGKDIGPQDIALHISSEHGNLHSTGVIFKAAGRFFVDLKNGRWEDRPLLIPWVNFRVEKSSKLAGLSKKKEVFFSKGDHVFCSKLTLSEGQPVDICVVPKKGAECYSTKFLGNNVEISGSEENICLYSFIGKIEEGSNKYERTVGIKHSRGERHTTEEVEKNIAIFAKEKFTLQTDKDFRSKGLMLVASQAEIRAKNWIMEANNLRRTEKGKSEKIRAAGTIEKIRDLKGTRDHMLAQLRSLGGITDAVDRTADSESAKAKGANLLDLINKSFMGADFAQKAAVDPMSLALPSGGVKHTQMEWEEETTQSGLSYIMATHAVIDVKNKLELANGARFMFGSAKITAKTVVAESGKQTTKRSEKQTTTKLTAGVTFDVEQERRSSEFESVTFVGGPAISVSNKLELDVDDMKLRGTGLEAKTIKGRAGNVELTTLADTVSTSHKQTSAGMGFAYNGVPQSAHFSTAHGGTHSAQVGNGVASLHSETGFEQLETKSVVNTGGAISRDSGDALTAERFESKSVHQSREDRNFGGGFGIGRSDHGPVYNGHATETHVTRTSEYNAVQGVTKTQQAVDHEGPPVGRRLSVDITGEQRDGDAIEMSLDSRTTGAVAPLFTPAAAPARAPVLAEEGKKPEGTPAQPAETRTEQKTEQKAEQKTETKRGKPKPAKLRRAAPRGEPTERKAEGPVAEPEIAEQKIPEPETNCFTGDTLIATEFGEKEIRAIEPGERVWSCDHASDACELQPVIAVHRNGPAPLMHLTTTIGTFRLTPNHPIYVHRPSTGLSRYLPASRVQVQDQLYDQQGATDITVLDIRRTSTVEEVFNLTVAHNHNYYALPRDHRLPRFVLVHNCDPLDSLENLEHYNRGTLAAVGAALGALFAYNGGYDRTGDGADLESREATASETALEHAPDIAVAALQSLQQRNPGPIFRTVGQKATSGATKGVYENPGHHDPSNRGPNPFNPKKSVLPKNHEELWNSSIPCPQNPRRRWTKVGEGKDAVYHRFEGDHNGRWHWNGSTIATRKDGTAEPLPLSRVPIEIQRLQERQR